MNPPPLFDPTTCMHLEKDQALPLVLRALQTAQLENSFKNFHVPGMHYINLQRSSELTVKLYICDPELLKTACGHYLVSPHDHSYCFKTIVLKGSMRNITFEETEDEGASMYRYKYVSGLKHPTGKPSFEDLTPVHLVESSNTLMPNGGSYYLSHTLVHTIVVDKKEMSILLLFQKQDMDKEFTWLYLTQPELPSFEGIYQRFEPDEFESLVWQTTEMLQKQL